MYKIFNLNRVTFLCFLFLGLFLQSVAAESSNLIYPTKRVIRVGDNMEWANPAFNDADWDLSGTTDSIGVFWVRFKFRCDSTTNLFKHPGLQVIALGAYEFYWDGQLIAKNGVVGKTKAEEVPGKFLTQFPIADSLVKPGIHTIALRVSNFYLPKINTGSWNIFFMEEYLYSIRNDLILAAIIFILAGIYLMAAIYYFFLFILKHREKEVFIFSLLCILFFGLIVMEYIKFLYPYPYHWHLYRLLIIFILTFLIAFFTPYFFLIYFKLSYKNWITLGIFGLLIMATSIWGPARDLSNENLSLTMWYCSMGILSYSAFLKKKEALLVLIAFFLSGCLVGFFNLSFRSMLYSYDISLFISFSLFVLSMMYLLAKRTSEQREAYKTSLLLSSRLQNELLKKNIQPHFIMNTLTSLMSWVEESPKESVQFIEALSEEFAIMSDIAEKTLIPLEQEIELCQKHIQIMRYRKEVDYIFEVENMPKGEMFPPATLHTIIENGITHNLPNEQNEVKMILRFEENDLSKIYTLQTFGKNRPNIHKKKGGTGIKYIKSRLTESYGDQWRLESKAFELGWETTITLVK